MGGRGLTLTEVAVPALAVVGGGGTPLPFAVAGAFAGAGSVGGVAGRPHPRQGQRWSAPVPTLLQEDDRQGASALCSLSPRGPSTLGIAHPEHPGTSDLSLPAQQEVGGGHFVVLLAGQGLFDFFPSVAHTHHHL